MINYLKLVRFTNLFFVALIQYLMLETVLRPIIQTYGVTPNMTTEMDVLLILATVFIAAGGYVLNDYFDLKIDAINRSEKQIVGKTITRRKAMALHQLLTALGTLAGLVLAYFARSFTLAFVFIVVPGLLWFYSTSYKRQFLTGNIVVSFIAALSVLITGIAQLAFLNKAYSGLIYETPIPTNIYSWVGGFALFSFVLTLIREVIKDLEDEKGDRELECRTMPIVWGTAKSKVFLYVLIVITALLLLVVSEFFIPFESTLTFKYIVFGLIIPLIVLTFLIYMAKEPADYHHASTLAKTIMAVGVLYSFIFYYLLAKSNGLTMFNILLPQ